MDLLTSNSVPYGLLPITARNGKGRTWAMCHALLVEGTEDDVFTVAECLYAREARRRGWDADGELRAYRNFDNYVQRLGELGVEVWRNPEGVWHARPARS